MLLRIEDLDTFRCQPSYATLLEEDLRWLGLDWDQGGSRGGPDYFQSRRTALYQAALERLEATGLVYPCFCTRAQLHAADAPHRSDGWTVYPGTCRNLTAEEIARKCRETGRPPALRLRVPEETIAFTDGHMGPVREFLPADCGDLLLRRSDGLFAYQLAVVVDDGAMGVTQVVRGSDLLSSTPRQLLLYRLLGLRAPAFYHLPLLLDRSGKRLSKRDGALDMGALRRRYTPMEVTGNLAFLAGLNPSARPCAPESLLPDFNWERIPVRDLSLPDGLF
jgi:glutamyl-tRNA synthetase